MNYFLMWDEAIVLVLPSFLETLERDRERFRETGVLWAN